MQYQGSAIPNRGESQREPAGRESPAICQGIAAIVGRPHFHVCLSGGIGTESRSHIGFSERMKFFDKKCLVNNFVILYVLSNFEAIK